MKKIRFLAIETSCDDTSVSVLQATEDAGQLKKIEALSNIVSSQTQLHAGYGGVYPFLAKREHKKNLPAVFEQATEGSPEYPRGATRGINLSELSFIGVTQGPGLDPCLWTGINFAQDLAKKHGLPLVGANHLEAHFLANLLTLGIGEEKFAKNYLPAVCLVVSGGHTLLFLATAIGEYKLLGETQDDAAGECFDKTARILGLDYPGGPEIAKYAEEFVAGGALPKFDIKLPRPMITQKNYNFSFSGLKTAVLYLHQKQTTEAQKSKEYLIAMSHEIQQAIVDVLVAKTKRAAAEFSARSIIIGGGVSANEALRKEMKRAVKELNNENLPSRKAMAGEVKKAVKEQDIKFLAPAPDLSVDNAAMTGVSAYFAWRREVCTAKPEELKADPNLSI